MKLMPHSLYGRLLAILLVGLMVPQLLSALVHLYDRDTLLHQTMGADSAEKISSIVELLDGVDPAMRSSMVEAISGYPLEVVLNDAKESTKHPVMERDAENEQLVLLFQEYLQRRLPGGYEAHVEVVESQRSSEWMQRMQLLPGMQRMHEQMQQRMGPPLRVKSFHVQVRPDRKSVV